MLQNKKFRELVLWPGYVIACLGVPFFDKNHPLSLKFPTYDEWVKYSSTLNIIICFSFCLYLVLLPFILWYLKSL